MNVIFPKNNVILFTNHPFENLQINNKFKYFLLYEWVSNILSDDSSGTL